jgi:hypothetical protein
VRAAANGEACVTAPPGYPDAIEALRAVIDGVRAAGGEIATCRIDPPATRAEMAAAERVLGRRIPDELVEFFLEGTRGLDVCWGLERDRGPGIDVLGRSLGGRVSLDLGQLGLLLTNWSGWEASFRDPAAHAGQHVDLTLADYRRLFPIEEATNGDVIVLVTDGEDRGSVVLLDHEGGDFDRAVLGRSLREFLCAWLSLGCPGPESFVLQDLYDYDEQRLAVGSPAAKLWLRAIRHGRRRS